MTFPFGSPLAAFANADKSIAITDSILRLGLLGRKGALWILAAYRTYWLSFVS
jgi:hypothetical protein